eukprot:CAMPEP_0206498168 /NCGR_PEP_ID=MMETSP0324_2-20121206/50770_1 /ASSEMBLY_ACC=CAM_ASM_000836 /TAXON_ID=2866 /ORGANISM="Crypthecodinium cohnii, Strain Seligo" /LENGTH=62 /DNA_ID=CAMNT_0053984177 /DNA_START=192 /DNA_END=381 /DNA_ORIENTATION=-
MTCLSAWPRQVPSYLPACTLTWLRLPTRPAAPQVRAMCNMYELLLHARARPPDAPLTFEFSN